MIIYVSPFEIEVQCKNEMEKYIDNSVIYIPEVKAEEEIV